MVDHDKLFFKIWKNDIIRNEIFYYNRVFNYNTIKFKSLKSFKQFKFKDYLETMIIQVNNRVSLKSFKIPDNVKTLKLLSQFKELYLEPGLIPNNVKNLYLIKNYQQELILNSIPNSIEKLRINYLPYGGGKNKLEIGTIIPSSVTDLILNCNNHIIIGPNILSKSIKSLKLISYKYKLEIDAIPSSVTNLGLDYDYNFTLESIPSTVTNLTIGDKKYKFNKFENKFTLI